jgi:hypothetical protein
MARKPGSREYRSGDNPLCVEMARLILRGQAGSAWDAAKQLAPQAGQRGYGTSVEQRTRRLYELYRDHEPSWIALAQKDVGPPRGTLAAFVYSMQPTIAHSNWIAWRARRRGRRN